APARAYSLAREAEDIAALAAVIGPGTPILAHSYGASATLAALGAGAPLGPCVLYEPPAATDLGPGMPPDALAEMEVAVADGDGDRVLELFFARALRLKPRAIEALRADTSTWAARAALAWTLPREAREVNAHRIDTARLAAVTTPATFLVGTVTTPALKRSTGDAHAAITEAGLVELGGQGHAAMDTDPAGFIEAVVAALER
ncbi:MAG TPA: alpha/beta fold hydrolase, partial [Solirubrobacteraceae bacterium]